MSKARRKQRPTEPAEAIIESLAQDGRGVAHINGKAVFIHGALPGERVRFIYERIQRRFDEGRVLDVLEPASTRVKPKCAHFGICGGCSLQHLQATTQIQVKEQILRDAMQHIGKVAPINGYLPPLVAAQWSYRRKARLGVKYVDRKSRLLVGFRERSSTFVADIEHCEILHPLLSNNYAALREMLAELDTYKQIPQIEAAVGDTDCALIFRVLSSPSDADLIRLSKFGEEHNISIYLQSGGPESVKPLNIPANLSYSLPDFGLQLGFQPLDFTQVNLELNRLLVTQALALLDPQPQETILDLFCGIGNFTLPLATLANSVTGVEGDAKLVARANSNALANKLDNCRFFTSDLYGKLEQESSTWLQETFDKVLLDPPRSGAMQVLPLLPKLKAQRILYISCNPATLARDAGILVHDLGYSLRLAGVMDMFPHTAHVESLALFERS